MRTKMRWMLWRSTGITGSDPYAADLWHSHFSDEPGQTKGDITGLIFQVSGISLPIRVVKFPGASAIPESVLQEASRPLLEQQYSKTYLMKFAEQTLAQLFRKKGYLRVHFKEPEVEIEALSTPAGTVNVILGLVEGLAYTWDKAVWRDDGVCDSRQR